MGVATYYWSDDLDLELADPNKQVFEFAFSRAWVYRILGPGGAVPILPGRRGYARSYTFTGD